MEFNVAQDPNAVGTLARCRLFLHLAMLADSFNYPDRILFDIETLDEHQRQT